MKKSIILILLLITYTNAVKSQSLDDTISFLEGTISSYPPLGNYKTNFSVPNQNEEADYFIYEKQVSYDMGGWAYSITSAVLIEDIQSILVTKEIQKPDSFYCIRLKLKEGTKSNYISSGKSGDEGGYLKELKIYLPENKLITDKIKKAIMHLGELKGVEIKDLDMF